MMKRRRSKYRIVVKTKAQLEREKRIKAKKALLERQRAMDADEIYSGKMMILPIPMLGVLGLKKEIIKKKGIKS